MHSRNAGCPLTATQLELLQAAVDHLAFSDPELARIRDISRHTVHAHFKQILELLSVHSRAAAILVCATCGWIDLSSPGQKIPQRWYSIPALKVLESRMACKVDTIAGPQGSTKMAVTNYYTVNGEIIGEKVGAGARTDYLRDALGSVVGTVNQSAQVVNTYRYKPFGAQLAKTGAGADPAFRWVGTEGYRQTGKKYSDVYVLARHCAPSLGMWSTRDPIRSKGSDYVYARVNPVTLMDPSGMAVSIEKCKPTDYAVIDSIVRQLCRHFHKGSDEKPGWPGVVSCVNSCTLPSRPGFGPNQIECMKNWCRTGRIVCDYASTCLCDEVTPLPPGQQGPPSITHNCACHSRHVPGFEEQITICMGLAMPGGRWNARACGCGPYQRCSAKECAGREGFFSIIHELQHHCGTGSEINADVKACCILHNLFDVIYPPEKCERGCPVMPGLVWPVTSDTPVFAPRQAQ